jgi:hypothetical protein
MLQRRFFTILLVTLILPFLTCIPLTPIQAHRNSDPSANKVVNFTPGNPANHGCELHYDCNNPASALGSADF